MKQGNYKTYLNKLVSQLWRNVERSEMINCFVMEYKDICEDYNKPKSLKDLKSLYKETMDEDFPFEFIEDNENKFLNNEYVKNVIPLEFKNKKYKLSYKSFTPYQPFFISDVIVNEEVEEINLGYFSEVNKYKYLSIEKKNNIWMEITPHEINTMQKSIDDAYGNVLVYGLGLGYYAYMISLKDNVESITIIENDHMIIEIFNTYIYPFFNHKEKIRIINEDALEFKYDKEYDYCFADLWHNAEDGLDLYFKLLRKENNHTIYAYWLEDSLIQLIRRYIVVINAKELIDKDYNYKLIYKLIKPYKIDSAVKLTEFLDRNNIKEIIKRG